MVLSLLKKPRTVLAVISLMREAKRRGVEFEDLPEELVAPRLWGKVDVTRWGLVPHADVVVAGPADADLDAACAAATEGLWEPAARLMSSTWGDWERRNDVVRALADLTVKDDSFIRRWHDADPSSGDLGALRAVSLVYAAWEVRGSARAAQTSKEQFEGFGRLLSGAQAVAHRAAEALPEDPTPWMALLMVARGLSYDHDRFGRVWDELVERAPHHRASHVQALQYWCRKWRGSHELMCDFAIRAASTSPALAALPLMAATEGVGDDPNVWHTPMVRDALETLLPRLAAEGAATKALRSDRGLAIVALMIHKRNDEAVDQFRVLGPHADGEPWSSSFDNPRLGFLQARIEACKGARKPS
ncbi:hypothetical protein F4560_004753 [Saccharothrix ecbatanensis]|uniref:DUF4034 domain-containing protein n=1 Tax=Saccharothrix ecbatanensis TaxID=1105145 RepID=A0A7W9M2G6_9PSEU|nr:DUF4034 domain-containing protein [Saccharothrix ecbatanensis]MBB5804985.1 hypothetical protein [Saccharothrix ecbatanensis]